MNDNTIEYRVSFRTREASARAPRTTEPPPPPRVSPAKTSRPASQLALGHLVEHAIEDGTLADYADAAERFGITRARVCQIVSLTLLSPPIQEAILGGEVSVCERELREVVPEARWDRQGRGVRRG